ncbi:MAG: DUF1847 domain-containing protein [Desulfobacterales bacterium]|nr:DUF1847 domain-containing protein [Desulfobacterales bacterium]
MEDKNKKVLPSCASCTNQPLNRICINEEGNGSKGCPTLRYETVREESRKVYKNAEDLELARQASIQEGECYANKVENPFVLEPTKTRIVEIIEFAEKMGYKRLGLAFCVGLAKEASIVEKIFSNHGFEIVSVVCKAGRELKQDIGIESKDYVMPYTKEAMCNPIFQAKLLNYEKTEFNVLLGLCVGHDSLFFKYAEAFTTVLAVKDRVTGHNPLAAIYLSHSYYGKIMR